MGRKKKKKKKLRQIIPDLLEIYRYFWKDIVRQRWLIASSLVAMLGSVLCRLLEPWPLKFVLDQVIKQDVKPGTQSILLPADWSPGFVVTLVAILVVVIAVGRAAADYFSRVGFFNVGNRIVIKMRDRVYRHLQLLPMNFHHKARSGDLIIRVTRDVNLLRDVTATAMLPLLSSVMVLVGMVTVMLWLNWKLALISMLILPVYWLSTVRLGRQIRETTRKQRERESAMAAIASESIGAIRSIKALSLEDKFAEQFDRKNNQSQGDDLKASRLSLRLGRTVDILLAISTALVLGYGAFLVLDNSMSAGDLVVFLVYLKRAFKPAQEFAKYTARMAKATAAGARVINLLEQKPEVRKAKGAIEAEKFFGAIEFRNVTFGYRDEQPVLKNFNLDIEPGQTVAIVGPSGAGKSTVLSLLMRLYEIDSGRLLVDDRSITDYTIESLRRNFKVVLQNPLLFHATIAENMAMGAEHSLAKESLLSAAKLARADEFIDQLPDKYQTVLGERASNLSRGQCQRLAIARAALIDAPILLLDEPTTGLDELNERIVSDSLLKLSGSMTTVMVTHNLRLASKADLIVYLADGSIQEKGSHEQLLAAGGLYAHLFGGEPEVRHG